MHAGVALILARDQSTLKAFHLNVFKCLEGDWPNSARQLILGVGTYSRGNVLGKNSGIKLHGPIVQMDGSALDEMELILGGLCGENLAAHPQSFQALVLDELAGIPENALTVADADGTPLALAKLSAEHAGAALQVSALARAEHGTARDLRVTEPLKDCTGIVLIDSAPSLNDVLEFRKDAVAGTLLLLVASSHHAASYQYPQVLNDLRTAAELVPELAPAHVVIPEYCSVDLILQALGVPVLKDLRRGSYEAQVHVANSAAGTVLMFTGLSGSGKSTLARSVRQRLQELNYRPVLLDGDDIRRFVSKGLGFSREDRETNVERIGWIGSRIAETGGFALCAPIAPFAATRRRVAQMAAEVGARFVLVHVSTSLQICEERDRKGLYAQARAGKLSDFTGIDSPYEIPEAPDLRLDLGSLSLEHATDEVLTVLLG